MTAVMAVTVAGAGGRKWGEVYGITHTKKKRVQTWSDTGHTQMFPCFCRSLDVITGSGRRGRDTTRARLGGGGGGGGVKSDRTSFSF